MVKQKNKTKLFYLFDKEADVLYLSQGKPSSRDLVTEAPDNVLLRSDKKTGRVRGFTILNFSKRQSKTLSPIALPVFSNWVGA
ncbi:MAG TPA: DUF2283 domain-containing protein [Candidatus Paceibacterota bacterium]